MELTKFDDILFTTDKITVLNCQYGLKYQSLNMQDLDYKGLGKQAVVLTQEQCNSFDYQVTTPEKRGSL